jgi:hypothetical protein
MINVTDLYKKFKKKNPDSDVTYTLFKYVISSYNKQIVDYLMEGGTFNLGSRLGKLKIKRVVRNFKNKAIDWGETNKLKARGINQLVYYTDEHYYGFFWEKRNCTVKNKSVYKFYPAGGIIGPKKRLIKFLKENELNKLNFTE